MNADELRHALRDVRDGMSNDHATRLHRAVSWLQCAEQYAEADEDMALIALWISFNSCYAVNDGATDHTFGRDFREFAAKLVRLDEDERIYNCLWFNFSNFIRLLIDNQWVFEPFWRSLRDGNDEWQALFEDDKKKAHRALADNDVPRLLTIIMHRLYTLRNQVVHGGATWQSSANRDQVRDGKRLMLELMPIIIELMFDEREDWGRIHYPYVKSV